MSPATITVRCSCGMYVCATDVYPSQTVEIARTFITHTCKENTDA